MHRIAAAALLLLLAACGEIHPKPTPGPDLPWRADPRPPPEMRGMAATSPPRIVLPETDHAVLDVLPRGGLRRLLLNVSPEGEVVFMGWRWRLGATASEDRAHDFERLIASLRSAAAFPGGERGDLPSRDTLTLNADRTAGWRLIREILIRGTQDPGLRMNRIEWLVWCPSFGSRECGQEAILVPLPPESADGTEIPVRLAATGTSSGPEIQLTVGETHWSFGALPGAPFETPDFLARANSIWQEAAAALADARGPDRARATFHITAREHDLPWAFVVKVLDLLLGADVRDVSLTEEDLHLILHAPGDPLEQAFEETPILTPSIVLACLAAVLLAVLLTFVPLRRTR